MNPEIRRGIATVSVRVGLSLGLVASASACVDSHPRAHPTTITTPVTPNTVPEQTCLEPSDVDILQTTQLADEPVNPAFDEHVVNNEYDTHFWNLKHDAAEKNGVTIFDYLKVLRPLEDDLQLIYQANTSLDQLPQSDRRPDNGVRLSFDQYVQTATDFLANYGIKVIIAPPDQTYTKNGTGFADNHELDNTRGRQAMSDLISSFGQMPLELIKYIGLEQVVFVKDTSGKAAGYVEPFGTPHTFFIDPTASLPFNTFTHELYHVLDQKLCGPYDARADLAYSLLNPQDIYKDGGKDHGQYVSDDSIRNQVLQLDGDIQHADIRGETDKVNDLKAVVRNLKANVVVPSEYSFTEVVEDKAEVGSHLLDPTGYDEVLDPSEPLLRKKAVFLLARLEHELPSVVKYFADVSYRFYAK